MKFTNLVILMLSICLFLPACNSETDGRYTGILANEDVVSSIRQDIADKENSLLANKDHVFWSESGTLWHKNPKCSYLANSETVLHGTEEEAKLEGKVKGCSRCSFATLDSYYDSLGKNEYKTGDVFFTRSGEKWHTDINCSEIVGAEKIYFADEETARLLGKNAACTECEN